MQMQQTHKFDQMLVYKEDIYEDLHDLKKKIHHHINSK